MMTYTCTKCGEEHKQWPALAWNVPPFYLWLSDQQKEDIAQINDDFCIIKHPQQTDRFIRVTCIQKVNDHCQDLEYGLWVSLSEENFRDYEEAFGNNPEGKSYFAWLYLAIDQYEPENIPCMVKTQSDGFRPLLQPDPEFDHPFVKDFYNGISLEEAEKRVNEVLK